MYANVDLHRYLHWWKFKEIWNTLPSDCEFNNIDKSNEWENDEIYSKACEEISKSSEDGIYTYVYKYYGEKKWICYNNI